MALVVVPCGRRKVWRERPSAGPIPARFAYTGSLFRANRAFAKRHGDRWVVLSAKYGFIAPDFVIPGDYDVTFDGRAAGAISVYELRRQVRAQGLDRFDVVIALGGAAYASRVRAAFSGSAARVIAPVEGLRLGEMLRRMKAIIVTGVPEALQPTFDVSRESVASGSGRPLAPRAATSQRHRNPPEGRRPEQFRRALEDLFRRAAGQQFVDISAGQVHRLVGGYPGPDHRMPVCCKVLRRAMAPGDVVVAQPPSGMGASLTIRYRLPRPERENPGRRPEAAER